MQPQRNKIEAIYDLREAVEQKVRAEVALTREDTPRRRDVLLDASLRVEAKTQVAIEVCHECGRPHATDEQHGRRSRVSERDDNVLGVDFRPPEERDL